MHLKNMLVISLVGCIHYAQTMEPPTQQMMLDNLIQKQSVTGYKPALQSRHDPDSPAIKKQAANPTDSEQKQEYTQSPSQELVHIVSLCDLETVCRLNKNGDPLIQEYEQRDTITKNYPTSAVLEFFAHVKKNDEPSKLVAIKAFRGSVESATHRGVVSAAYFFSSKQYFCTVSLRHSNGQFMPPRYLDVSTFDALYRLFQEQETERNRLAQLKEEQSKRHTYLEKKLKTVARQQRKRDLKVVVHIPEQQ